jgi:hypothetical protein
MTGWDVQPGKWQITQGIQPPGGDLEPGNAAGRLVEFERAAGVEITFEPRATTLIDLKLVGKGVPYWSRPDLGIGAEDVRLEDQRMKVTVHSLGAVDAPPSRVVLRDRNGSVLAAAAVPALKAPVDLMPRTGEAVLSLPNEADWKGGSVTVECTGSLPEITLRNNRVEF